MDEGTPTDDELAAAMQDPVVLGFIEDAVAPYRGHLTAAALADLEELLLAMLLTHPEVAPCVERLRKGGQVQRSHVRARPSREPAGASAASGGRKRQ